MGCWCLIGPGWPRHPQFQWRCLQCRACTPERLPRWLWPWQRTLMPCCWMKLRGEMQHASWGLPPLECSVFCSRQNAQDFFPSSGQSWNSWKGRLVFGSPPVWLNKLFCRQAKVRSDAYARGFRSRSMSSRSTLFLALILWSRLLRRSTVICRFLRCLRSLAISSSSFR